MVTFSHTNKLVRFYQGVDGLKTGYTSEAGFCLTATIEKNNMRLIAIVMGEPSSQMRNSEVSKLLDYGYNMYENKSIIKKDQSFGTIKINKAKQKEVEIVANEEFNILKEKGNDEKKISYKINIEKNEAPIIKGENIGSISIYQETKKIGEVPLTVKENLKKVGYIRFYFQSINKAIIGNIK